MPKGRKDTLVSSDASKLVLYIRKNYNVSLSDLQKTIKPGLSREVLTENIRKIAEKL